MSRDLELRRRSPNVLYVGDVIERQIITGGWSVTLSPVRVEEMQPDGVRVSCVEVDRPSWVVPYPGDE